jgi:hypothetical protein
MRRRDFLKSGVALAVAAELGTGRTGIPSAELFSANCLCLCVAK